MDIAFAVLLALHYLLAALCLFH